MAEPPDTILDRAFLKVLSASAENSLIKLRDEIERLQTNSGVVSMSPVREESSPTSAVDSISELAAWYSGALLESRAAATGSTAHCVELLKTQVVSLELEVAKQRQELEMQHRANEQVRAQHSELLLRLSAMERNQSKLEEQVAKDSRVSLRALQAISSSISTPH